MGKPDCKRFGILKISIFIDFYQDVKVENVDLISVVRADDIFNTIEDCLAGINLNLVDCVGLASDGASVMVGEHDYVWTRIATVAPNCIKMSYICHSLSLCIQHAFEKLPSSLGFLLSKIPKWFSKSTLRRETFMTLFEVMNPDEDPELPFVKCSKARWWVRGKVIYCILTNWEELKAYFMTAEPASTQSARYKARILLDMLKDPIVFLYFHFASPLVTEFERVNAFFQATDVTPKRCILSSQHMAKVCVGEFLMLKEGPYPSHESILAGSLKLNR